MCVLMYLGYYLVEIWENKSNYNADIFKIFYIGRVESREQDISFVDVVILVAKIYNVPKVSILNNVLKDSILIFQKMTWSYMQAVRL